ncbi:MAG: transposase [Marinilabiliaceae bacterium]|nr:transposase [Marinilabiliaceae bacterium]
MQTDGYEAYSIYEQKKGVLLLGCWAHARRKILRKPCRRQSRG